MMQALIWLFDKTYKTSENTFLVATIITNTSDSVERRFTITWR